MDKPDSKNLQPAFVLHRRPYSNSSQLLECFTAGMGRFPVIARGGRSAQSRSNALLQPFTPLLLAWRGRGEVKTLAVYEQEGPLINLEGRALYCGFYINELLMRLVERSDPHEALFGYYAETLYGFTHNVEIEPLLRRFERLLLHELGYGLILDRDAASGAPLDPDRRYHYELERGPLAAGSGAAFSIQGSTLLALGADQSLTGEASRDARGLMRRVLAHYLGDRPLKSRELFRTLDISSVSRMPSLNENK